MQDSSAEFLCRISIYGDCGKDKSSDECGANTQKQALQLWSEAATTVTALDNLITVMWKGETKTQYENAGHKIPKFIKYLRTFGEAGIVKDKKMGRLATEK